MFNLIPVAERKMIENYILKNAVPNLSPDYIKDFKLQASLEHILRFWSKNKVWLFESFGNQFIHSKEIKIEKPKNELREEFRTSHKLHTYYLLMLSKIRDLEEELTDFERWVGGYCSVRHNVDDFMENKYTGSDMNFVFNKKKINIVKGMKMTKVIRKVSEAIGMDSEEIDNFCTEVSRKLNDKHLTGELCVSIHPLDYMTMSDNDSDWRSCMRWDDDGCYKQGTVEMMNSENVVVVYLKSKNDMKIGEDEFWNNKKWRCLYIVDKDFIFSVKPYPYYNDALVKAGAELIAEVMNKNLVDYQFDIDSGFKFDYDCDGRLNAPGGEIYEFYTNFMYNDIEEDPCTNHYTIFADRNPYGRDLGERDYNYSGESECMFCGGLGIEEEEDLVCYKCAHEYWHKCDYCNTYVPIEVEFTYTGHISICPHCAEHSFTYDKIAKELVPNHGYYETCICTPEQFNELLKLDCVESDEATFMGIPRYSVDNYTEDLIKYLPMYRVHEFYDMNYRDRMCRLNIRVADEYNHRGYWYYLDIFDATKIDHQIVEQETVKNNYLERLIKNSVKIAKENAENDN